MHTYSLSRSLHRGLALFAAGTMALAALAGGGLAAPAPAAADPFASAAFQRVWERTDLAVAQGKAARSWLWGDQPFVSKQEKYTQGPSGTRLVQYFDKSRMEINDPTADPAGPWFVTNGLLVVEMMTGRIQTGNNDFQQAYPANIPVAGDGNDPAQTAPTYAAMAHLTNVYAGGTPDGRIPVGTPVTAVIDKNGVYTPTGGPANLAHIAVYSPDTRHNIPDVFWTFLNSSGTIYQNGQFTTGPLMNWIFVMGYPTTEPYWTTIRVGGQSRQVLVQAFQRRILTYTPSNPAAFQVEMGNVGRAYYNWRYQQPACTTVPVRGFGKVWAANPEMANAIGCPVAWQGEQAVTTAVEHFEHGSMLFVAKPANYGMPFNTPSIFVFFNDGTYQRFDDTYVDGQPASCSATAPTGLLTPVRGFGKIWCEGTGARVRERLGWATDTEKGANGAWQVFDRGIMFWTGAGNQVFALFDINSYSNVEHLWLGFTDTFNP